jgi:hypothetical protein
MLLRELECDKLVRVTRVKLQGFLAYPAVNFHIITLKHLWWLRACALLNTAVTDHNVLGQAVRSICCLDGVDRSRIADNSTNQTYHCQRWRPTRR